MLWVLSGFVSAHLPSPDVGMDQRGEAVTDFIAPRSPSVSCADSSLPEGAILVTVRLEGCTYPFLRFGTQNSSLREGGGSPQARR